VAVATGAAFAALGSDTAGSVRLPAAFCGVSGLEAHHGSLTVDGIHELHLLAHRAAGQDPLTNLGQERVAQVQIQRNALETAARLARARLS